MVNADNMMIMLIALGSMMMVMMIVFSKGGRDRRGFVVREEMKAAHSN